eukprot:12398122-Ditylum_brightwellii.AAC.1
MLSSLEEREMLSKSLIACMSRSRSLIVSSILSLTNVFGSLTSLPVRPRFLARLSASFTNWTCRSLCCSVVQCVG